MEGRHNIVAPESGLTIKDWHAHIYFDAGDADHARSLCAAMRDERRVAMGHVHISPVGPHPRGSCQMTISRDQIAEALEWLVTRRGRFTVFIHANTGNDWNDHTAHVVWLGESEALNLRIFSSQPGSKLN